MTTPAALRYAPVLAALQRALSSARRDTAFLAGGLPLHLAGAAAWLWLAWSVLRAPAAAPVPVAVILAVTVPLTAAQRWRYQALLGVRLPRLPASAGRPGPRRVLRWIGSPDTWRQIGYHAVAGPVLAASELLVLGLWAAGLAGLTVYAWIWVIPSQWRFSDPGYTTQAAYVTAGAVAVICAADRLARTVAAVQARIAGVLLGPGRASQLQRRIEDLAQSRAGLVAAADAERRRIERDLHDGAQQRLVSLAVNLGVARATLTDLPASARQVIDQAHREAKEAITELSDLVRGLHPAVLEDRGLDAALSGLAARLPLPVRLRVRLDRRPSPAVESVAYFVISEALANVAKHARASQVEVNVDRAGAVLRLSVTDDGAGGADASGGTGLTGLARRVSSVDGTFRISSPAGGPTTLIAELPCKP